MNSLLVEWISINYLPTNGRIGRKEYILGIIFDYTILLLLLSAAIYGGRLEKYFFSLGAVVRAEVQHQQRQREKLMKTVEVETKEKERQKKRECQM